jgi:DNA-binding NtrC family response regulator
MDTLRNGSTAVLGETASDITQVVPLHEIVGRSSAYVQLISQIRKMAGNDASVMIEGETGSGKELAARAMHYLSRRREKPFVPLNCGAIPDTLIEAELFGHVRGSFTDAKHSREGVIAHANGGTLFLDEVDTLSTKGQITLLRFLQDRRYRPVGHSCEQQSDVRIIAASNKPMKHVVAEGEFRTDLLYRLNVLGLKVPALRERVDDIVPLAEHYLEMFCTRYDRTPKRLDAETAYWLQQYDWPGNVRELENLIHRIVLLSDGETVHYTGEPTDSTSRTTCPDFQHAKAQAIELFERTYLIRVMAEAHGNVSEAARIASKERRALGKLLKKHGIDKDTYRAAP